MNNTQAPTKQYRLVFENGRISYHASRSAASKAWAKSGDQPCQLQTLTGRGWIDYQWD